MFQVIDLESGQTIGTTFENGSTAAIFARQYQETTGKKAQVRVIVSDHWREREKLRFESGDYLLVAWHNASWWLDNQEIHKEHYAHRSKVKDSCIAYTESPEKGTQDRQTRIKAGAYLTKYFSHILDESQINYYARLHAAASGDIKSEIKFAKTADEIEHIYTNGPDSCMSHPARDYDGHCHPVRVYGDSDLQLAYVERESDYHDEPIAARALVWPERKIYGRVYPTPERYSDENRIVARAEYSAMIAALEELGYTSGRFDGAKIKVIQNEKGNGFIMPYLDGTQGIDLSGDHFVILRHGDYTASETTGLVCATETFVCERCGDDCDEDDTVTVNVSPNHGTEQWCEHCAGDHTFTCHGLDEVYSDWVDHIVADDGNIYSLRYAERNLSYCDKTEQYITDEGVETVHTSSGEEQWCESAITDHAFFCHHNDSYYCSDDFESVEIDNLIYEKQSAIKAGLLTEESESI